MENVELKLYRDNFQIHRNYGFLHRIVRSVILAFLVLILTFLLAKVVNNKAFLTFSIIAMIIGGMFLLDSMLRKRYADWPKAKNFVGSIHLKFDSILINKKFKASTLNISDCVEFIVFYDHFKGYGVNGRDIPRNGNALIFVKKADNSTMNLKFNISSEKEFELFNSLLKKYNESIPYFKYYSTYEVPHILTSDLSSRIKYV